jgi:hypothetical protein
MDIVFVVDDSGSMKEEQDNLAANFPEFVKVLDQYKVRSGEQLDYRLAVTTTGRDLQYTIAGVFPANEKGDNGAFRQKCGMTRRWIERTDANVATTFKCAAAVGTGGPSIEMPLYALKLAFDDRVRDGTNAGFLRDDALLAVVILTDEDDCSRADNNFDVANDACDSNTIPQIIPVDTHIQFLDTLKKGRGRWASAVIAGPGPGTCSSSFGNAYEATRLKDFVSKTGKTATFSSICAGNLAQALKQALDTFDAACQAFPPPR